ncbi:hypothetical protein CLV37_101816 [Kineococcus rhizosphaerae]|uniref:Uncharacterized protein n=1 Tax=Kineococcus rhizosphaerae TaxID=559628 RepID=A0A2T0RBQ7_9ACTN|nr:hypothetical protein CLV37_101816 [Kineococcus rhizosphaerae]
MSGGGPQLRRVAALFLVATVGFALAALLTRVRALDVLLRVCAGLAALGAGGVLVASRGERGR